MAGKGGGSSGTGRDRGGPGGASKSGPSDKEGKGKTGVDKAPASKTPSNNAPPTQDDGFGVRTRQQQQDMTSKPSTGAQPDISKDRPEARGAAPTPSLLDTLFAPPEIFGNPIVDSVFMGALGLVTPPGFTTAMKIGQLMGQQVQQDQTAVDAGTLESDRMDDPGMGRVDNIKGQGIGSLGNAMADDRAENVNGLGGGTTSGGSGGQDERQRAVAAAAPEASAAPVADAVALTPEPNTEIGRLLQQQKRAAAQAGGQNVLTGGQGLGTPARTAAQRLFGT